MTRIGLIVAYEENPYVGVVRPFINWNKALQDINHESTLILYRSGERIKKHVEELGLSYTYISDKHSLYKEVKKYDVLVVDDYLPRLRLLLGFRKLVAYVQVFYGIHAISLLFNPLVLKEKLIYSIASLLPFKLIARSYINSLRKIWRPIANSYATQSLLTILYGIESYGVVYPPVDTDIFFPKNKSRGSENIILYLGSNSGDTDIRLLVKICKILNQKKLNVLSLGNKRAANILRTNCTIKHLGELSDEELADYYREASMTICPQKWEQFGYVVAESIASGTPVLVFNLLGPGEIVRTTRYGIAVNNSAEMIDVASNIENYTNKFPQPPRPSELPYAIERSTRMLAKVVADD